MKVSSWCVILETIVQFLFPNHFIFLKKTCIAFFTKKVYLKYILSGQESDGKLLRTHMTLEAREGQR